MAFAKTHWFSPVQRDFDDPYLELIRLLKEAGNVRIDFGAWFQNIGDVKAEAADQRISP